MTGWPGTRSPATSATSQPQGAACAGPLTVTSGVRRIMPRLAADDVQVAADAGHRAPLRLLQWVWEASADRKGSPERRVVPGRRDPRQAGGLLPGAVPGCGGWRVPCVGAQSRSKRSPVSVRAISSTVNRCPAVQSRAKDQNDWRAVRLGMALAEHEKSTQLCIRVSHPAPRRDNYHTSQSHPRTSNGRRCHRGPDLRSGRM